MDGIRLNDHEALEAHGVDKQKIVEEITRAYAHQIYVDGFFNGDPHPGRPVLSLFFYAFFYLDIFKFMFVITYTSDRYMAQLLGGVFCGNVSYVLLLM